MYTLMRLLNLKVPAWLANFRKQSADDALRMRLAPPPHFEFSRDNHSDAAKPFRPEPAERAETAPAGPASIDAETETIEHVAVAETATFEAVLPATGESEPTHDGLLEAETLDSACYVQTEAMPNGVVHAEPSEEVHAEPSEDQIRMRAYGLYLARNGASGNATEDWLRAEAELRSTASASRN